MIKDTVLITLEDLDTDSFKVENQKIKLKQTQGSSGSSEQLTPEQVKSLIQMEEALFLLPKLNEQCLINQPHVAHIKLGDDPVNTAWDSNYNDLIVDFIFSKQNINDDESIKEGLKTFLDYSVDLEYVLLVKDNSDSTEYITSPKVFRYSMDSSNAFSSLNAPYLAVSETFNKKLLTFYVDTDENKIKIISNEDNLEIISILLRVVVFSPYFNNIDVMDRNGENSYNYGY